MIEFMQKPYDEDDVKKVLNPLVRTWFFDKFNGFSLPQLYGVLEIHNKNNVLVSAPTGGTKTLTAFLSIINELINLDEKKELKDQVYCVYVSPLKALNRDVEKNLKEPLQEIEKIAGRELGIRVAVRTGDTTASEKQKMLRKSPHVLITTPESLALMLTSIKFKELLKDVKYVIIDEVHALADNKRGVHLSLSLERLQYSCNEEFTRIGLSATCAPLESIAGFLVGNRDCRIANVEFTKKMDLKVISPVKDLINVSYDELHNSMYNMMDNLIQEHKTTLIFTNTRSATERVVHHLREKFPKKYTENIGAHHGSLSKKHRHDIEDRLRKGELKCIVCSTSLELGIDIGYIDLVICLGSPKSVARFLQRTGRSGHRLHDMVKGRMIVLDRDDLVECSVLLKNAIERKIDRIHIPENCLDVLSQQIYGIAIADKINIKDLFKLVKGSYCYRNLDKKDFDDVINYLAGNYISLEDRHVYAKIWHDEETGMIGRKGKLARVLYMTNIGTIPDETFVLVKVQGSDEAIGTIEESFLERLKRGDVFVLGGARYEFLYSKGMVAYVNASVYRSPTIPSWFSEMLPLSFDLAMGIQVFRRHMEILFKNKKPKKEVLEFINSYLYVEDNAALAIYNYFNEQFLYIKEIPNDKKLLIEFYRDEEANKKYAVFHSLYGRRVNDVLSRAIAFALGKIHHSDFEIGINDNGFYIASNKEMQVLRALSLLKSKEVYDVAKRAIENTEVLKRRFRHCATRALMILRQYKGYKKRVGKQQVASQILINALKRIDENFSILKEARREVLEDLMDIENATSVIKGIEEKKIEVKQCSTNIPSPFAFNIVLQGYTDVFKIEDKMQFLKRMHDMVLAKIGKENRLE